MKQFHVVYSYEIEVSRQIATEVVTATLGNELGSMIVEAEVFPNKETTTNEIKEYIEKVKKVKRPNLVSWKVKDVSIIFVREFTEQEHQAYTE
jgi:ribosomal protein L1